MKLARRPARSASSHPHPHPHPISHLGLVPASLEGGVVTLPDGRQRAALEVSTVNVRLLSEQAAGALQDGYLGLLASLTFPLQIVVRAHPTSAASYLGGLRAALARERDPRLLRLVLAQQAHVERLLATAEPLDRRCYVVVPAPDHPAAHRPLSRRWRRGERPGGQAGPRQDAAGALDERCAMLAAGLQALGLRARPLDSPALAELLYAFLCPRLARLQPLPPGALDFAGVPIYSAGRREGGRDARLPA